MSGIHEAKVKIAELFRTEFGKEPEAIRFVKLAKSDGGCKGTVEVTEPNEYLKNLGYPPIFDRNHYTIVLDESFDVIRYGREEEEE
jgi:hypothetical protein